MVRARRRPQPLRNSRMPCTRIMRLTARAPTVGGAPEARPRVVAPGARASSRRTAPRPGRRSVTVTASSSPGPARSARSGRRRRGTATRRTSCRPSPGRCRPVQQIAAASPVRVADLGDDMGQRPGRVVAVEQAERVEHVAEHARDWRAYGRHAGGSTPLRTEPFVDVLAKRPRRIAQVVSGGNEHSLADHAASAARRRGRRARSGRGS